ncbi:MAG: HAD-IA family hydrolase [Candidatus Yanofskybacteria bacterium]|nr:HAD-IA family hydrolase [Candidatus Yanofskybacteria bacterium]
MERQVELINFDYGNVLAGFKTQKFYDFVRFNQWPGSPSPESFFRSDCLVKYELDQLGELKFFEAVKFALGLTATMEEFFSMFSDVMKPDPRMIALRQILKQNGFKVAVISNINRYHFEYVRQQWPEVFMGFDYLALSFLLKIRKPNWEIFDATAKELKVPPERCLLIDDQKINVDAFGRWGGIGHHYNVVDDAFCPNGCLETERNRLLLRMVRLRMLSLSQAGSIVRVDF